MDTGVRPRRPARVGEPGHAVHQSSECQSAAPQLSTPSHGNAKTALMGGVLKGPSKTERLAMNVAE
jgi:hypothetical protein